MLYILGVLAVLAVPTIGLMRMNNAPGAETEAAREVRGETTVGALIR